MRPVPDVALPRARKASFEQPSCDPRITTPATFFLSRSPSDEFDDAEVSQDSMYGVQSLDEAIHQATLAASECDTDLSAAESTSNKLYPNPANNDDHGEDHEPVETTRQKPAPKALDLLNSKTDPPSLQPPPSDSVLSRPLTPLNLSNPDDPSSSLPSSPKSLSSHSLKPLDDISITDEQSQAVVSGEEDNEDREIPDPGVASMPQLIMPSLRMPSRRPFTSRGKAMGRLKVLLAGASGSGKTSLIRSIVRECEDIVHMDPFPPTFSPKPRRSFRPQHQMHDLRTAVSEIYASTKPYPSWWSDLEDSRVLQRKKSMGDIVLERNLCFIDTPATSMNQAEQTEAIIQYMHHQLSRAIAALDSSNVDFQSMLAGNGGSQVDTTIYLISQSTLGTDVECIRKLCNLTNVIPVIAKSDLMSPDQIATLKSSFQKEAQAAGAKPFLFGNSSPGETDTFEHQIPFAVSSAKSSDDGIMDASTLMSPDYVQPLVLSELSLLVQNLFDRDHSAWMRHSTAKKLAQRQREQQQPMRNFAVQNSPSSMGSPALSGMTSSNHSLASPGSVSPVPSESLDYTLSRITDHTQREEILARVHLMKWASGLQQSLHNERERYATMERSDRAVWLTQRLSECLMDGSLVPITLPPSDFGGDLHTSLDKADDARREAEYRITRLSPYDPLGVVWWTDDLKQRGWVLFQIVGSFGVVGGLALALARIWGFPRESL